MKTKRIIGRGDWFTDRAADWAQQAAPAIKVAVPGVVRPGVRARIGYDEPGHRKPLNTGGTRDRKSPSTDGRPPKGIRSNWPFR